MPKGKGTYNTGTKTYSYSCPCMGEDLKIFHSKTGYDLFIRLHNMKCNIAKDNIHIPVIWGGTENVSGTNFEQSSIQQSRLVRTLLEH